jgi:hypothetical protein
MGLQRQAEPARRRARQLIAAALGVVFLTGGAAMADTDIPQLSGPRLLSAAGDNHTKSNTAHLSLAGLVVFDGQGGASSLDVVVQGNDFFADDGLTCELTTPSDLSYIAGAGGVGTLRLVIGPSDNCLQTTTGNSLSNAGEEIDFDLFIDGKNASGKKNEASFVSTASNLTDGNGNAIDPPNTVGSIRLR